MTYLNLLRELAEQYAVKMESQANGDWKVLLGRHGFPAPLNEIIPEGGVFVGFEIHAQGSGKTPEEAIRAAYLIVNPIPRNNLNGKLTQT